jgi:hypothetical protein
MISRTQTYSQVLRILRSLPKIAQMALGTRLKVKVAEQSHPGIFMRSVAHVNCQRFYGNNYLAKFKWRASDG